MKKVLLVGVAALSLLSALSVLTASAAYADEMPKELRGKDNSVG
jgi:hypothetical protein